MTLRMATSDDAAAVAAVYLPYVRDTAISFETQQPSVEEMRSRLTTTLATLPWLVITDGPRVKGYAYASPHRGSVPGSGVSDGGVSVPDVRGPSRESLW